MSIGDKVLKMYGQKPGSSRASGRNGIDSPSWRVGLVPADKIKRGRRQVFRLFE